MKKVCKPYQRKLSSGTIRWYVQWNGKQVWVGRDESEAHRNWDRLKNGQTVERPGQLSQVGTVGGLLDLFGDWVIANCRAKFDANRSVLKPFKAAFGDVATSRLSVRKVQKWVEAQSNPERARRAIVSCFRRPVVLGHISESPVEAVEVTVKTITDLLLVHAERHYVKNGKATSQVHNFKSTIGPLVEMYGSTSAHSFGPKKLKEVRSAMIRKGWCRTSINQHMGRVRQVFKYAVQEEMIPAETLNRLKALSPLLPGRSDAGESEPVKPVSEADVEATMKHVPPMVADMIRVERLTGMRPGEVCSMRWDEIDTSGDVWLYRPTSHKVQHHGLERVIAIGPKAQAILNKYRGFGPVFPGRKGAFTAAAYRRAITRGCEIAFGMPKEQRPRGKVLKELSAEHLEDIKKRAEEWRAEWCWAPNQLRHSFATELRKSESLDVVAAALGHSKITTSQVYAENNLAAAAAVIGKIG